MIYIKTDKESNNILNYMIALKKLKDDMEEFDSLIYSEIPLYEMLKREILYTDFAIHPMIVKSRKFYEESKTISSDEDIKEKIGQILEHELSLPYKSDEVNLCDNTINALISFHKKFNNAEVL